MFWRKIFRRTVSIFFIVSILSFAAITRAEIYTGEGSYVMSEGENLGVAKERAKADAMRNASEQACVYVKNYSRMKNFKLEEDVIETMTTTILKLIGSPNFFPLETVDNLEGVLIHVVVKVEVDDSDITRWLNKSEQEKSMLVSQMEALRKANEEQAKQIAELKRQLAQSTTKEEKERITNEFAAKEKIFLSNKKVDEGLKLYNKGDCNGVIKVFDKAIEHNPKYFFAYSNRGVAYKNLKQYERAIQDYDKAIELNPNNTVAKNNRER